MILDKPHPTYARIDVDAFRNNLRVVRSIVGPHVKIMPVVKANAYGHGVVALSKIALEEGVAMLGVARSIEAFQLRTEGIQGRLLLFEVVPQEHEERCLRENCDLTVISLQGANRLSASAGKLGVNARVHVKIDTGMGRLGVPFEQAVEFVSSVARLPHISLEGIYSHFATSEVEDQSFALLQLGRFTQIRDGLAAIGIQPPFVHMANSGAIITFPASHFTMVRPGLMLYGFTPRRGMSGESLLRPVLSLRSHVSFVKTVAGGTSISYGRRYFTERSTRIATIPIGYADGFSRLLTNKGSVLIRGRRYPVAGTVCMDHIMVDIGPESDVHEGDEVVVIGRDETEEISGWDIAELTKTIPYEVTCLITSRVPRVAVDAPQRT
ncbi:MAG: alanine racemase [Bacteroidota bacterium]